MSSVRYDMRFTGTVQGVGFRATASAIAGKFRVDGWVRNEPDGSVRCVAEGEPDELDRFVAAVQDAMAGRIRDTRIERAEASGEFDGFTIRR